MNFNIIAAADDNGGIGLDNKIPWCEPDDMKFFSTITKGNGNNAIVMGNNTWKSLPNKPLKKRDNLILSRKTLEDGDGYKYFNNVDDVISYCRGKKYETVWIIGGAEIYKYFMDIDIVNTIYINRLNKNYNCNVFFPNIPISMKLTKKSRINDNIVLEIYSS